MNAGVASPSGNREVFSSRRKGGTRHSSRGSRGQANKDEELPVLPQINNNMSGMAAAANGRRPQSQTILLQMVTEEYHSASVASIKGS